MVLADPYHVDDSDSRSVDDVCVNAIEYSSNIILLDLP